MGWCHSLQSDPEPLECVLFPHAPKKSLCTLSSAEKKADLTMIYAGSLLRALLICSSFFSTPEPLAPEVYIPRCEGMHTSAVL